MNLKNKKVLITGATGGIGNNLVEKFDCIVIENYNKNINENILYSFINQVKQFNKIIIINSSTSLKNFKIDLVDLKSRLSSFLEIKIDLPTDDLIRVIKG